MAEEARARDARSLPPDTGSPPPDPAEPGRQVLRRLNRSYLVALALVALAIVGKYVVVERYLDGQAGDAEIVNVAGRQRMLSQRIIKLLRRGGGAVDPDLAAARERFRGGHDYLKETLAGTPARASLVALDGAVDSLSTLAPGAPADADVLDAVSDRFLASMDDAVNRLSAAAEARVRRLRSLELWLTVITLGILGLEVAFIFLPLIRFTARQLRAVERERGGQADARERAEAAYRTQTETLHRLDALTAAIDRSALFATLRGDGTVVDASRKLRDVLALSGPVRGRRFAQLLHRDPARVRELHARLLRVRTEEWRGQLEAVDEGGGVHHLQLSVVPARRMGLDTELFVIGSEVTEAHLTRLELDRLNAERLAEAEERGRTRSRLILEIQEKERLRMARDLHDGIGQQLTALKFGLEGLSVAPDSRAAERLTQLRGLCKDLIRGVRMATFNLSPPELADYGLAPALEKLTSELSRLTGENIRLRGDGFAARLSPATESNLYRVVQEAVNNAIKYAEANYILVTLSAGPTLLSVAVDDDGRGFDAGEGEAAGAAEGSGLGMAFMRERVEDLGGRMFVRSRPGEGPRVTFNLPLDAQDTPAGPNPRTA